MEAHVAVRNARKAGKEGNFPVRSPLAPAWPKGSPCSRPNPRRKRRGYEDNLAVRKRQSHKGK